MISNLIPIIAGSGFQPIEATGGTVTEITVSGITYRVHSFTSTGTSTFTVNSAGDDATVEYLIVGGGGGGGGIGNGSTNESRTAGGGGAGGFLTGQTSVSAQNYIITVGAGGAGGTNRFTAPGQNGGNSSALGFTAIGGGRGGVGVDANMFGANGGSGGGGAAGKSRNPPFPLGGTGTAGQGNNGGTGGENDSAGGGGGGAGGVGQGVRNSVFNAGGAGLPNSLRTGSSVTYAAGGFSVVSANALSGQPSNSGNGGNAGSERAGVAGGSGIVVIRYPLEEI